MIFLNDYAFSQSVVQRLGAHDYVHDRGFVPYYELPDAYTDCDGYVFASTCETRIVSSRRTSAYDSFAIIVPTFRQEALCCSTAPSQNA